MNTIARLQSAPGAFAPLPFAHVLRIYATESWYEFVRILRLPSAAVPILLFPAMFYLLFGIAFAHGSVEAATQVLASMAAFGVMAPGLFGFGVSVANERERGFLQLKRAQPMPPGAYLVAKMAMAMLFALAIVIILAVLSTTLGHVRLGFSQWLALVAVDVIGVLPFCAIGLFVGTLVGGQAAPAISNLVYLPMSFLSGLWVPLAAMPVVLQKIAPVWPAAHLGALTRAAIGVAPASIAGDLGSLAIVTLVFFALALRRLSRRG